MFRKLGKTIILLLFVAPAVMGTPDFNAHLRRMQAEENGQLVPRAPASAAAPGTGAVAGADANDPTKPGKHKKPLSPEDRERMRNTPFCIRCYDECMPSREDSHYCHHCHTTCPEQLEDQRRGFFN